ncbi:MAG: ComEC/Rec2 family competence protein, partial [Candidatus Marinimicrobia bacterium]|nr:ComEC/Rec2 family competence protein [Candidatus Neomarinimicrobiota bacterium]
MSLATAPALRYALYFCIGICLKMIIPIPFILSTIFLLAILILNTVIKDHRIQQILLILCIIICGLMRLSLAEQQFLENHAVSEQNLPLEITVLKQKTNPYYIDSYIVLTKIGSQKIKGTLYARKGLDVLLPGKCYHFSGMKCKPISSSNNPYAFNYLNYAKVHGLSHTFQIEKNCDIEDKGIKRPLIYYSHQVRYDISVRFLSVLGIEKGSLVNGLLLGLKSEIPSCIADLFRQMGVSHLLAVSGLHVGLIMLIIYQLLLSLSIPRVPRSLIIALFLIFYCFLTGGSPSVIRSSLMSVMLMFAPVFQRKYQALNAVAASAVILLMINPFSLQDLGFQFSFAAVFGILIGYSKIKTWIPLKTKIPIVRYLNDMLGVSLSAALFTAPVAMFYFNSLLLASMFLNLLVIPLTFCVMICAILALPGLYLPTLISDLVIQALDISLDVFRFVLRLASRSGVWTLQVSSYWKPLVFGLLLVCLIITCVNMRKWKIYLSLGIIFSCLLWFFVTTRPEFIQLYLENGEAIAYRSGRHALIINTGAVHFNSNDHERSIQPLLDHWGVRDVTVVVTAWEKGKYGNIASIRRMYPTCQVFIP